MENEKQVEVEKNVLVGNKKELAWMFSSFFLSSIFYALSVAIFINNTDNNVVPGGVSGLGMFLSKVFANVFDKPEIQVPLYSVLYIILNIPLFLLAFKKIGKIFAVLTLLNVISTSLLISLFTYLYDVGVFMFVDIEHMEIITRTNFAGVLSGLSTGTALSSNLSTGGTDVVSLYFGIKKGVSVGKYILGFNAIVIVSYGLYNSFFTGNINAILYTLIYTTISSFFVDTIYTRSKKHLIEIVTDKSDEIRKFIIERTGHTATIIHGEGAYTKNNKNIIQIVISLRQTKYIIHCIQEIDSAAFIIQLPVSNIYGKFYIPPFK
ncbi:MAG: YitT family protein [Bacillales bacterium]|jgi:uncharacterized membrane-anchored protein YitT (DUF2179 family)|nr:YitT family protein [Bacillales bacterium]